MWSWAPLSALRILKWRKNKAYVPCSLIYGLSLFYVIDPGWRSFSLTFPSFLFSFAQWAMLMCPPILFPFPFCLSFPNLCLPLSENSQVGSCRGLTCLSLSLVLLVFFVNKGYAFSSLFVMCVFAYITLLGEMKMFTVCWIFKVIITVGIMKNKANIMDTTECNIEGFVSILFFLKFEPMLNYLFLQAKEPKSYAKAKVVVILEDLFIATFFPLCFCYRPFF